MKEHICHWIPKIRSYSLDLDDPVKICNRPWVLTNQQQPFRRMVFRPNGKLLESIDGKVSNGQWELLLARQFLLLNTNADHHLYRIEFLDDGLMILQLDGREEDIAVFANQQIIPDLDVEGYLNSHYSHKAIRKLIESRGLHLSRSPFELELELVDGRMLQFVKDLGYTGLTRVKIDGDTPADGFYKLADNQAAYRIKNGLLRTKYYLRRIAKMNGTVLEIGYIKGSRIRRGCPVWLNGCLARNGKHRIGWLSSIVVECGKVKKVNGPARRRRWSEHRRRFSLFNWFPKLN